IRSSYAICVELGQSLPQNLNKYFEGNFFSMPDWVHRVAHYLKEYATDIGVWEFVPQKLKKYFRGDFFSTPNWIYFVAHYLKDAGWDSEQNNIIPKKGSNNWETLLEYNNSGDWVRAVIELATTAKWDPADLNYKLSN
nr:hypothetical protein [Nanoarchaeota archaeon]